MRYTNMILLPLLLTAARPSSTYALSLGFSLKMMSTSPSSNLKSSNTPKEKWKLDIPSNTPKTNLPARELINRRKSPALWREDLTFENTINHNNNNNTDNSASTTNQNGNNFSILSLKQPPEVMAPVGGFPQLHAAIANGADSIYLGLSSFSARARASNFGISDVDDNDELTQAVHLAHAHNVRVYVALNTLVFNSELFEVESIVRKCLRAGVDALIVQDQGVASIVQAVLAKLPYPPSLEIHASTQQTVTCADGVFFAKEHSGASRVVLGRELSVSEIRNVASEVHAASLANGSVEKEEVEVEAFVHGALCVSYSGQCFSSEAWGGRSANRGQCAQACRLPYGLIRDGNLVDLQDMNYLLSPQDLCGLDQVEGLVRAGVSCLKIEGRLKDEKYVAATTRAYRNAVDEVWDRILEEQQNLMMDDDNEGKNESLGNADDVASIVDRHQRLQSSGRRRVLQRHETVSKAELAQLFSRGQDELHDGLSPGFFEGSQHQHLVRGRSPRHRGVHAGRVVENSSWRNGLVITNAVEGNSQTVLKRGDGIVIDRGMPQEEELGGPIYDIQPLGYGKFVIRFGRDVEKRWKKADELSRKGLGSTVNSRDTYMTMAPPGAHVWKTSDATIDKKMKRLIGQSLELSLSPPSSSLSSLQNTIVRVSVEGSVGEPLTVKIENVDTGICGVGRTDDRNVLVQADRTGLDEKSIQKAIGTLGNTRWIILDNGDGTGNGIDISAGLLDGVWCPMSWVKEARRRAVEDLERLFQEQNDNNDEDSSINIQNMEEILNINVVNHLMESAYDDAVDGEMKGTLVSVLARSYDQVVELCQMIEERQGLNDDDLIPIFDEIIIDFLEVDGMKQAVSKVRKVVSESGVRIRCVIASPRIIKPGESGIWRTLLRLEPDGLLIRSTGLIHRMKRLGGAGATVDIGGGHVVTIPELIGDFSLNAVNALTARDLLDYGNLSRITAAYDLSANAITELAESMGSGGASRLEVIAHAHLPIFHTEHCVFARFLSKGNSYLDCGHVCTRHNVHLRDQSGDDNLVLADMGCRNTVFSAQAQSGVHSLLEWAKAGVGRIRIELIDEGREDVRKIVSGYAGVLAGDKRASVVWESLQSVCDSNGRTCGVSHGSLRNTVERRAGEL